MVDYKKFYQNFCKFQGEKHEYFKLHRAEKNNEFYDSLQWMTFLFIESIETLFEPQQQC